MERFEKIEWYALYTKPRHEKFVEEQFLNKGIEAFTPKVTLRRKWSDRVKKVEEPIFKGYCFARFPLKEKAKIVREPGVMNIVNFNKNYVTIKETVINSLKIMVENELKIDPCPYISKGDFVVIKKGSFKGLQGYVLEKRNKNTTLVVSIDSIGASVKCTIDMDFVDLVYGN